VGFNLALKYCTLHAKLFLEIKRIILFYKLFGCIRFFIYVYVQARYSDFNSAKVKEQALFLRVYIVSVLSVRRLDQPFEN